MLRIYLYDIQTRFDQNKVFLKKRNYKLFIELRIDYANMA